MKPQEGPSHGPISDEPLGLGEIRWNLDGLEGFHQLIKQSRLPRKRKYLAMVERRIEQYKQQLKWELTKAIAEDPRFYLDPKTEIIYRTECLGRTEPVPLTDKEGEADPANVKWWDMQPKEHAA